MTYELAKQLKDAGFRQDFSAISWGYDGNGNIREASTYGLRDYGLVKIPTLSDLIEAINNDMFGAMTLHIDKTGFTQATSQRRSEKDGYITGSTPEEAAAKLYIELNKNATSQI